MNGASPQVPPGESKCFASGGGGLLVALRHCRVTPPRVLHRAGCPQYNREQTRHEALQRFGGPGIQPGLRQPTQGSPRRALRAWMHPAETAWRPT
eukprot:2911790-Pyramimonas_sp.AAC.1